MSLTTRVSDSFDRADGALAGSTLDNALGGSSSETWTVYLGTHYTISGNRCVYNTLENSIAIVDSLAAVDEQQVSANLYTHFAGIIARWVTGGTLGTHYLAFNNGSDKLQLLRCDGEAYTQLGSDGATTIVAGDKVTLYCNGGNVSAYINDVLELGPTAGGGNTTGKPGFYGQVTADNFKFEVAGSPASQPGLPDPIDARPLAVNGLTGPWGLVSEQLRAMGSTFIPDVPASPGVGDQLTARPMGVTRMTGPWGMVAEALRAMGSTVIPAATGGINADSSAALPIGGAATGTVDVKADSTKALPLGGAATGVVAIDATSSRSLPLSGSAAATVAVAAVSSQPLPLAGTATGVVGVAAVSSQAIPLSGSATGVVGIAAASSKALPLGGSITGVVGILGDSSRALPLSGTAAATVLVQAISTMALPLAGLAAGTVLVQAVSTQPLPLGWTSAGTVGSVTSFGDSNKALPLAGTAVGLVGVLADSVRGLPLAGAATGVVGIAAVSVQALPFGAISVGAVGVVGASTRAVLITGTTTGVVGVTGQSVAALPISGSATGAVAVHVFLRLSNFTVIETRAMYIAVGAQATAGVTGPRAVWSEVLPRATFSLLI
jgi:hypothetical protein